MIPFPLPPPHSPVRAAAFGGGTLLAGTDDGRVVGFDRFGGPARYAVSVGVPHVRALACHPDGERFAAPFRYSSVASKAMGDRDRVRFFRLDTGRPATVGEVDSSSYRQMITGAPLLEVPCLHADRAAWLAFAPDGRSLVSLGAEIDFGLDPQSEYNKPIPATPVQVCPVAPPFAPGGPKWLTARRDVQAIALSADGTAAAVASHEWVRAGRLDAEKVPPAYAARGRVKCLALSPDGSLLAGSMADDVTIWENRAGQVVQEFAAHAAPVQALATHPTEGLFASAGRDGKVLLWEAETGRVRAGYDFALGELHALAFSPDGLTLAVAGHLGLACVDLE